MPPPPTHPSAAIPMFPLIAIWLLIRWILMISGELPLVRITLATANWAGIIEQFRNALTGNISAPIYSLCNIRAAAQEEFAAAGPAAEFNKQIGNLKLSCMKTELLQIQYLSLIPGWSEVTWYQIIRESQCHVFHNIAWHCGCQWCTQHYCSVS